MKKFPEIQNLSDALRKQAFLHKRFAKGILEPIESPREVIRRIQMQSPAEMLRHIQMQSPEFIHKSLISPITKLVEELSELPERYREALKSLGKEGWFYSPEMSTDLLSEIDHLLIEDPNGVSEWLCDFFRGRINDIEQELLEAYPQRKRPLHDAFEAHREGKYSLSVPVFLTQADGIFLEKSVEKKSLFIAKERKEAVEKYASQFSGFNADFLQPLKILLPLWKSERQRESSFKTFTALNRHQVLHGESVEYDTEENSLKVVSLLNYLHCILKMSGETVSS